MSKTKDWLLDEMNKQKKEYLECTVQRFEFMFTVPTEHDHILTQIGTEEELKCSFPGCRILNSIPLK